MLLRGLAFRHRLVGIFVFQFVERETAGFGDFDGAGDGIGKFGNSRAISAGALRWRSALTASRKPASAMVHFSRTQVSDIGERPALRRVIEDVIDGDERRMQALAEFGQQAEPARFVAAMIMDAGEESAARRRAAKAERRSVKPLAPCLPRLRGRERRQRRERDEHLAFARGENLLEGSDGIRLSSP